MGRTPGSPTNQLGICNLVEAKICAKVKVDPMMDGDFFLGECLGVSTVPWCPNCTQSLDQCQICSSETVVCSEKEVLEYASLKSHFTVEPDSNSLSCKYPFCSDPFVLQDNGSQELACQRRQESRQIWGKSWDLYKSQFQDMIDLCMVVELKQPNLKQYDGPVNYIAHHEVLKNSASTLVRIVSNSSFPNGRTTLDECLVKGPNTLNCLFSNLVRFHSYEDELVFDYTKAYN